MIFLEDVIIGQSLCNLLISLLWFENFLQLMMNEKADYESIYSNLINYTCLRSISAQSLKNSIWEPFEYTPIPIPSPNQYPCQIHRGTLLVSKCVSCQILIVDISLIPARSFPYIIEVFTTNRTEHIFHINLSIFSPLYPRYFIVMLISLHSSLPYQSQLYPSSQFHSNLFLTFVSKILFWWSLPDKFLSDLFEIPPKYMAVPFHSRCD